jgi:DNA polymerase-3 subunit delta
MFLLLHGADDFSAGEELARLRASGGFEHNQDTFAGGEVDLDTLRNVCDTLPFLSERRLVVLDGLPKRKRAGKGDKGGKGDKSDPDEGDEAEEAPPQPTPAPAGKGKKGKAASGTDHRAFIAGMAEYVPRLPETTVLVVLAHELLEPTHLLAQAASRYGRQRAFTPPKGAGLADWLAKRAASAGATLAPEAARLLVESSGEDLRALAHEIDKLSTYVGQGGRVRLEDVRALTPVARQARVFDLTDALVRRDCRRALALLHELLAQGESPLGIVALTAFQTRALLQVKTLTERGLRAPQIAQQAGLAPYVVEKSLPLARQLSFAQVEVAHRHLFEIDTALKRSRMTPEMALDLLVLDFGAERI